MTTTQLILLLLLVVVVVLAVFWLMRRGSAKDDAARVEAEELRGRAQEMAAAIGGQQTFAEQAEERAAVAKAEAEARAAEATRLEEEAAAQRAVVAETQREYEAQMRRADEIDPDVTESAYAAPVDEQAPAAGAVRDEDAAPVAGTGPAEDAAPTAAAEPVGTSTDDDRADAEPQTRAERRAAREQAGSDGSWGAHAAPAAAAGAAGGAAAASAWGSRDHEGDRAADSERVASAADYRDDVADGGDRTVSEPAALGTAAGMADETNAPRRDHDDEQTDLSHDTATPSGEWGGPRDPERDADAAPTTAADTGSTDTDTHTGSGTHAAAAGDASDETADGGVTIIDNIEDFAATEPVLVEDQAAPVERDGATGASAVAAADEARAAGARDDEDGTDAATSSESTAAQAVAPTTDRDPASDTATDTDAATHTDADAATHTHTDAETLTDADASTHDDAPRADEHATAETGAAVAATDGGDTTGADRFDPTPDRDWAADEGELLEENHERAGALEEERHDLDAEATDAAPAAAADERPTHDQSSVSDTTHSGDSSAHADADTEGLPRQDADGSGESAGRRVSGFDELRDGGYGVGSAATLDDGAQPLDHAIAGYRESMTFRAPGDAGYDDTDPDVWFYDEGAAERSGFRRAEG